MKDVSDELEHKGKSAGMGCYYEELWHQGTMVATWGYNGVHIFDKGYMHTEEKAPDGRSTLVRFFQIVPVEPQVPL